MVGVGEEYVAAGPSSHSSSAVSSVLGFLGSATKEAAGIIHNELYSVNCVRIACSSENMTVLGFPQVLMKGFRSKDFLHDAFHFGVR